MKVRRIAFVSVAALWACAGGDTTRSNTPPSYVISDGAHRQAFNDPNGNPDFFFLPTMVPNPINDPNFNPDDFNPKLSPTVEVCNLPGTQESEITLTTPCVTGAGAYFTSFPAPVNVGLQRYAASWTVPVSNDVFYRIRVKVGDVSLGFADVHTVPSPSQLKAVNQDQFIGQQDGSSLPIRFRIEIGALCDPPGRRPCDSSTLDFASGGTVNISTDGGHTTSGVTVPGGNAGQHTLTVQQCKDGDLNPRATDLPTFGSCITAKLTPALGVGQTLDNSAIVQVCDLAGSASTAGLFSEAQEHRVTLHRLDGTAVRALPHVAGCAVFSSEVAPTMGSVLAEIGHGHLKAAGGKLLAMLGPTPLNARRRRLDLGGGGSTFEFSDFQFALPAKMEITAGNPQTAPYSSTLPVNPTVKVTDLGGDPVARATVHFTPAAGSVGAASVTTGASGLASTSWTLGVPLGIQQMTASGRGIAGGNFDGPRCSFDPFQSIQLSPHPAEFGQGACTPNGPVETAVLLQEGTRVFGANSILPFSASGYSYKVVSSGTASPTGWQLSSFNEAVNGFVAGAAAFGASGSCTYAPATPWTIRSDILVRRTFTLASAQSVQVRVAMDNDIVAIYLNGVAMSGGPTSHTGCAAANAADNSFFTGTGVAGTNLLTIRAHDQGGSGSFLDVRVAVP